MGKIVCGIWKRRRIAAAGIGNAIWRVCDRAEGKAEWRKVPAADGLLERTIARDAASAGVAYGPHAAGAREFSRRDRAANSKQRLVRRSECGGKRGEGQPIHDGAGGVPGAADEIHRAGGFWYRHRSDQSQAGRDGTDIRFLPEYAGDTREPGRRTHLP